MGLARVQWVDVAVTWEKDLWTRSNNARAREWRLALETGGRGNGIAPSPHTHTEELSLGISDCEGPRCGLQDDAGNI